ncbi:MAG: hypothetical protein MRJ96_11445 [Nitrospirales bacterium]|nr:hypothetical protein [Nitrospira sp.]MDR4502053.1 hypothetical protein [Nitrospirales bacterium]
MPGDAWTVYGEAQKMPAKIRRPNWSVTATTHKVVVVDNPLSDEWILPYSDPVPNTSDRRVVSIVASPGEYEPASFVLRAGTSPLSNVVVKAHDLKSLEDQESIPAGLLDVRIVKSWYQSAAIMRRVAPGQTKQFVSELLLHDDQLVQVDHQRQVNLVRTRPTIYDAPSLLPFTVQACTNKQIWVTVKLPETIPAGHYSGTISITMNRDGLKIQDHVDLDVEVLQQRLLKPAYTVGMFYLGWLTNPKSTSFTGRSKTRRQMQEEFLDMKEHGVDTVGLDHQYNSHSPEKGIQHAFENFRDSAKMLLDAGYSNDKLVYIDWNMNESNSPAQYTRKIDALRNLSISLGYRRLWVYNQDEKKYHQLISQRHTFETVHAFDALNITAVTKASIAQRLKGLLDVAIIQHDTSEHVISSLKADGIAPLAYGMPHSTEERPATTRATYGFSMVRKGFSGIFSYAYQSGYCWDDWAQWGVQNYRPGVMAYPTEGKPIPTLQWEGWREAIDDLRYLATYLQEATGKTDGPWPTWLKDSLLVDSPHVVRKKIIQQLRKEKT